MAYQNPSVKCRSTLECEWQDTSLLPSFEVGQPTNIVLPIDVRENQLAGVTDVNLDQEELPCHTADLNGWILRNVGCVSQKDDGMMAHGNRSEWCSESTLDYIDDGDDEDGIILVRKGSCGLDFDCKSFISDIDDQDHDSDPDCHDDSTNIDNDNSNHNNDSCDDNEDVQNQNNVDELVKHSHDMPECVDIDQSSEDDPDLLNSPHTIQYPSRHSLVIIPHLLSGGMPDQQQSVHFSSLYSLDRFLRIDQASEPLRYEASIALSEHRISQGASMFLRRLAGIIQGDDENESFGRPKTCAGEENKHEPGYTTINYW